MFGAKNLKYFVFRLQNSAQFTGLCI